MSDIPILNPSMTDLLSDDLKNNIFATLNCIQIGKISSIKPSEQTVEVELQVKRRIPEGKIQSYPLLVDCPFIVLQGGGSYIDMPIKAGDYCLMLFNDRNIDTWWTSANVKEAPTKRKHSLSDGFALVGINPKTSVLDFDGSKVRILGTSGAGAEQPAARQEDTTVVDGITDTAFIAWITTVSAFINGLAPGTIPNPPTSVAGKIDSGSSEVSIG